MSRLRRDKIYSMNTRRILFVQAVLLAPLFLAFPSVSLAATQPCTDKIRKGAPTISSETTNADAVGETTGIEIGCAPVGVTGGKIKFQCLQLNFSIFYTNNEGQLTFSSPTQMPIELIRARKLALSGDPTSIEPGGVTGAIPKILPPDYKQVNESGEEVDPKVALTKAEGQLVQGWVVENQLDKQKKIDPATGELQADSDPTDVGTPEDYPYYDVRIEGQEHQIQSGEENYQLEGTFGEVAPLYDRYGILSQALSFPTSETPELPDVDCPADTYNPRAITLLEVFRKAIWRAKEVIASLGETRECDLDDFGCIADALIPFSKPLISKGDLDVQSKVSLAGGAWANMAGPSGAFAALLPPETIFKAEDNEKPSVQFDYLGGLKSLFGQFTNTDQRSTLKIASLGNVGKSVDCLIYGLTAHPANAQPGVCDEVLVNGKFLGWPTFHGFIFQGPITAASCTNCTHEIVEAIDVGPGPNVNMGDPVLATTTGDISAVGTDAIYGNYIDLHSTDPDFPTTIRYGHLSVVYVGSGQPVSPGDVIGAVGDTGMGGVHLHYEFRYSALKMEVPYIPDDGGGAIRGCLGLTCPKISW